MRCYESDYPVCTSRLGMAGRWLLLSSLGVVLAAWYLSTRCWPWSRSPPGPPSINNDGTVIFNHTHLFLPSTVDELITIIKSASSDHRKVKVLGAGHSRSSIAHSSDIYVSLYNFTGVVRVEKERREVVVKAGTMVNDLNSFLKENGLALSNLPTLGDQTVGGALSVGSHGTGSYYGNMATYVTRLTFVSGTGELISVSANSNEDLFKAVLVSIGMLGVLTEVTFQCEKSFNLREQLNIHPLDYCVENFYQLANQSEHGKLWLEAHSETCAVFDVRRTDQPVSAEQGVELWSWKFWFSEPLLWAGSWLCPINPLIMTFLYQILQLFTPYERVAVSHDVFIPPLYVPNNHQMELVYDMRDCQAALQEWRKIATDPHANLFTEVRYVKADDIWLSPNYQRESCHITILIYNPTLETMAHYFDLLYNTTRQFHPRLHWGKYLSVGREEVEQRYPRLQDFARIRAEMDPNGIFINDILSTTFGFE